MTMKLLTLIARVFRRSAPAEGVYRSRAGVLEVGQSEARLVTYHGAEHIVRLANDDSKQSWLVTVRSDVTGRRPEMIVLRHERTFPITEASDAVRYYKGEVSKLARLNRDAPPRGGHFLWALGGAAAVLAVGSLLAPAAQPQATLGVSEGAALSQAQPESVRAAEQLLAQLAGGGKGGSADGPAKLTPQEVSQVQKAKSIDVLPAAAQLIAFSDPLCPSCKELDVEAEKLPSGTGFKVIPVGFQDGARAVAAAVLCSKDPKAAWSAALRGQKPTEPACEAGLQAVDENNRLFTAIGATATPTLMAPNGTVAAGSTDAKTLAVFVGMNGK